MLDRCCISGAYSGRGSRSWRMHCLWIIFSPTRPTKPKSWNSSVERQRNIQSFLWNSRSTKRNATRSLTQDVCKGDACLRPLQCFACSLEITFGDTPVLSHQRSSCTDQLHLVPSAESWWHPKALLQVLKAMQQEDKQSLPRLMQSSQMTQIWLAD